MRLKELGQAVGGSDYAAVSAAIKRFEQRLTEDDSLQRLVRKAEKLLNIET